MLIKKDTIKDISFELDSIIDAMQSMDYVVSLEARVFSFKLDASPLQITEDDLRTIYFDVVKSKCDVECRGKHAGEENRYKCIAGSISKENYQLSLDTINKYLSLTSGPSKTITDMGLSVVDKDLVQWRSEQFWNGINKHFSLPPSKTFQHTGEIYSYFGFYVMWHFCYIYLDDTTGTGIVIAGNASD